MDRMEIVNEQNEGGFDFASSRIGRKCMYTWHPSPDQDLLENSLLRSTPARKELLQKWDLLDRCRVGLFRFDQRYEPNTSTPTGDLEFLQSLFDSSALRRRLGDITPETYRVRDFRRLRTSTLNMNVFDVFCRSGVVRPNGIMVGCHEQYLDHGVIAENNLKRCLFDPDYEFFSLLDGDEFIVQLMEMMVLGGPFCQYEDDFNVYLDMVKQFYKSLMTIVKDSNGAVRITSTVFRIVDGDLFPLSGGSPWNRCYVLVDSSRRQLALF